MIKAVVFDLDDTLYSEMDYVRSGFKAVATEIEKLCGVVDAYNKLLELFAESREKVFDRYIANVRDITMTATQMVEIYRNHEPNITLFKDAKQTLASLREKGYKLGIITDGEPSRQRKKISVLELADMVDEIIVTDELGGEEFRKPNSQAFELMCKNFAINANEMLYVGDNPKKDFAVKKVLPLKTAELFTSEKIYGTGDYLDNIKPDFCIANLSEVINIVGYDESLKNANNELRDTVHEKLFELLKFVDMICRKENIQYSLCGGTLLGAIRHGGFIPWDDDVDVVMTRADLSKFLSIVEKYIAGSPYELYKRGRVDGVTFKKGTEINGIRLDSLGCDLFVLDNVPDDDKLYHKQIFALKKLQGMMKKGKIDWKKYSLKGKLLVAGTKFLGMFHSEKNILEKYSKLSQKYNGSATRRKFISNDIYAFFDIAYNNELLEKTVMHKFESGEFPIFKSYREILTMTYGGGYLIPPPLEERKFLHVESR